jgi:hypothetical protein
MNTKYFMQKFNYQTIKPPIKNVKEIKINNNIKALKQIK